MEGFNAQDHSYTKDGTRYPSVTRILADQGFYGDAAAYFTEYSRDRGSFVHAIIEYHLAGELDEDTIDPVLLPYFDSWRKFEQDTGYVSLSNESVLASDTFKFFGILDHIGMLNGCRAIIDTKTGAIMPAAEIQLAGYDILDNTPGTKRYGLQLKPDGTYRLKEFKDRQDRGIFLSALACYQWKHNHLPRR